MASNRNTLKAYFNPGDRPTDTQFADLIDSTVNVNDKATDIEIDAGTNDDKYVTVRGSRRSARKSITVNGLAPNISTGDIQITTIAGNSGTSSKLVTPRTINGVPFDGSTNITLPAITTITGNAATATKLAASKNINGLAFDGSTDIFVQKTVVLAGDFASPTPASTSRVNVTGLSFSAVAGKKYKIEIIGDYQTEQATTGGSLGFIMSSGTATIKGLASMEVSITVTNTLGLKASITEISATNTTPGSFITSTGVSAINTPHNLNANLVLTCVTSGIFQVQWSSEVANSPAKLNEGTVMIVTQLN